MSYYHLVFNPSPPLGCAVVTSAKLINKCSYNLDNLTCPTALLALQADVANDVATYNSSAVSGVYMAGVFHTETIRTGTCLSHPTPIPATDGCSNHGANDTEIMNAEQVMNLHA